MDKVTKRRLEKLIEFMDSLPRSANKHFNMSHWFDHDGPDGEKHGFKEGKKVVVKKEHLTMCGTSACALGWAATMPYFKRIGLKSTWTEWGSDISFRGIYLNSDDMHDFLALDSIQSEQIFGHDVNVSTPKQWAKHARKMMREWTRQD